MEKFFIVIKGLLIGIANIIPGVSGGTFALILGIFQRLMNAIKAINGKTLWICFRILWKGFTSEGRQEFLEEWKRIDGNFLLLLGIGAGIAILGSSWIIDYLLKHYPALTLAFFIGLILPSLWIPYRMMEEKNVLHFFWLLPGIGLTVGVSLAFASSSSASPSPLFAFFSGALAISAMILPGVSGSFVLLVLGQYQNVITAIKTFQHSPLDFNNFIFLASFGLGCLFGLASFARLLSYLLKKFPSPTMAFLIGLILGSLWVLWPFKHYDAGAKLQVKKRQIQIAAAPNRLPKDWGETYPVMISFVIGMVGAAGVSALGEEEVLEKEESKK
ncbi:MAG: DUF368 domain-containing protein [Planctomycetota bacterium]|nr:MAG: DUF368 domain-containing protein [Planctomycetota bacterium]